MLWNLALHLLFWVSGKTRKMGRIMKYNKENYSMLLLLLLEKIVLSSPVLWVQFACFSTYLFIMYCILNTEQLDVVPQDFFCCLRKLCCCKASQSQCFLCWTCIAWFKFSLGVKTHGGEEEHVRPSLFCEKVPRGTLLLREFGEEGASTDRLHL